MDRRKQFEVEALEPRILLSGEGMAGAISPSLSSFQLPPGGEIAIVESMDCGVQNGQGNLLSAASRIDDIFAGLNGEYLSPVFGSDAEPVFSAAGASEPVQESAPSVTGKAPEVSPENAALTVAESSAESSPETTVEAAKNPTIPPLNPRRTRARRRRTSAPFLISRMNRCSRPMVPQPKAQAATTRCFSLHRS